MTEQDPEKPEILIVDDSKVIRRAACKMLQQDYIVHEAVDGVDGWTQVQQNPAISVVFTDMQMPEMNGIEMLDKIRESEDEHIANLPVIMVTGRDDTEDAKLEVFEHGATDFISKPFESIDLISRAKAYARLTRKVVELEKQTGTDRLTGLANASCLEEQGAKALSFAHRHKLSISVVHFEIEGFQELFLSHGKNIAQQIIVATAGRLKEALRAEDLAARTGVARFALLLPVTCQATALTVINRIREVISKLVFDTGKEKIRIGVIAGYTTPELSDEVVFSDLLEQAESALESARDKPESKVEHYHHPVAEPEPTLLTEEELNAAMQKILDGQYYQIPEQHLSAVVEKVRAFMEYVDNQDRTQLTATDAGA